MGILTTNKLQHLMGSYKTEYEVWQCVPGDEQLPRQKHEEWWQITASELYLYDAPSPLRLKFPLTHLQYAKEVGRWWRTIFPDRKIAYRKVSVNTQFLEMDRPGVS